MSKRERRDRKNARGQQIRGNAVRLTGPIIGEGGGVCLLRLLVGNPAQVPDVHLVWIPAIIDTGATSSCVSEELAAKLGLVPHGKARVTVVGATPELDQAPLLIGFPTAGGGLFYTIMPVTIGKIPAPMLYGMSELTPGILTVDTAKRVWEWRVPNAALGKPQPPAHVLPPPSDPKSGLQGQGSSD